MVLYRLSFRLSTENAIQVVELPGTVHEYLLEGLKPDSVYLVRITAATRVGLGESSVWTSHRTPKATSVKGNERVTPPGDCLGRERMFLLLD